MIVWSGCLATGHRARRSSTYCRHGMRHGRWLGHLFATAPYTVKRKYGFIWGEEIADLEIANGQRVSDAKVVVADYWNSMTELITLLYLGKQLKDCLIISSLRIPPDGRIVVYIRDTQSIYLRSCQNIDDQMG
jgi:hypothetical protein